MLHAKGWPHPLLQKPHPINNYSFHGRQNNEHVQLIICLQVIIMHAE